MDNVLVRPARLSDFDDLRALYLELTGGLPVPEGAAGRERLADILGHPGTTVFGAEAAGQLVSAATLHICPNLTFGGRPYARIENVVTLEAVRGQGLGRLVMQAAVEAAWAAECCSIVLLTGKALGARGFYESLGFNADDKWGMILRPGARAAA